MGITMGRLITLLKCAHSQGWYVLRCFINSEVGHGGFRVRQTWAHALRLCEFCGLLWHLISEMRITVSPNYWENSRMAGCLKHICTLSSAQALFWNFSLIFQHRKLQHYNKKWLFNFWVFLREEKGSECWPGQLALPKCVSQTAVGYGRNAVCWFYSVPAFLFLVLSPLCFLSSETFAYSFSDLYSLANTWQVKLLSVL